MNREAFEANYASSHDLPLETFSQYRMGDTYRLPGIASHWRTWQMALECAQSDQFKIAYQEFIDKTEWVQKTAQPAELGKHRADILRSRINAAEAEIEALRLDAERYRWLRDKDQFDPRYQHDALKIAFFDLTGGALDGVVDSVIRLDPA